MVLLCLLPPAAWSSVSDTELQQTYGGKVLTLRQFYPGAKLHFDSNGNLNRPEKPGAWTVDGQLRVQKITLKDRVVQIQGLRLLLFYDHGTKQLRDLAAISKDEAKARHLNQKFIDNAAKVGKVTIEVDCGTPQPEMADVTRSINSAFLAPNEPLAAGVPIFWKRFLEGKADTTPAHANGEAGEQQPQKVGGQVQGPRVTYDPDPEYSEPARKLKYQATVIFWLVVDRDGKPTHIRVETPAGLGLDEEAFASLTRWKFNPATKNGEPVPVMINVEVNFRLY